MNRAQLHRRRTKAAAYARVRSQVHAKIRRRRRFVLAGEYRDGIIIGALVLLGADREVARWPSVADLTLAEYRATSVGVDRADCLRRTLGWRRAKKVVVREARRYRLSDRRSTCIRREEVAAGRELRDFAPVVPGDAVAVLAASTTTIDP